jgi:hypothetical protein
MAGLLNSIVELGGAPLLSLDQIKPAQRNPCVLFCGCTFACAVVVALTLTVLFWSVEALDAAILDSHNAATNAPPPPGPISVPP